MVFDLVKKMCVLKTDDFVCRLPPKEATSAPNVLEATPTPTSVPDTDALSRLPTRLPTLSPSASPVSPNPTTMSPSANPTARPSKSRVTQSPTTFHAAPNLDLSNKAVDTDVSTRLPTDAETEQPDGNKALPVDLDEEVVDISSAPNADEPGDETDDVPAFVATERSFWNTSISPSNEASKAFTPLVVGAIAVAGVLVVVFAAVMFGLGQRHLNRGPEINIKPGDKIQIDNLEDVVGSEKTEEDAGFASNLMDMLFGSAVGSGEGNENATMGPDGGGSTIITRQSLKSAGSKMNSILKSVTSNESANKVLNSIKNKVRQKSDEATKNSREAVQEATEMTAQNVGHLGERVFSCASDVLCLPNNVQQPKQHSRSFNGRVPYKQKQNLEEAFFDDEISIYEDV